MMRYWQSLSNEAWKEVSHKGRLKKKASVWSGRAPTWQVKTKGCPRTHTAADRKGNPTDNTFTWTMAREKKRRSGEEWQRFSEGSPPRRRQTPHVAEASISLAGFAPFFEEVWRTSALQFVACVHACCRLPVCALVSHPGVTPPYVGGWFGWECLASVSLPVSDTSAHITGFFVPNVTPLRGRERIPSLARALFPIALICPARPTPP